MLAIIRAGNSCYDTSAIVVYRCCSCVGGLPPASATASSLVRRSLKATWHASAMNVINPMCYSCIGEFCLVVLFVTAWLKVTLCAGSEMLLQSCLSCIEDVASLPLSGFAHGSFLEVVSCVLMACYSVTHTALWRNSVTPNVQGSQNKSAHHK